LYQQDYIQSVSHHVLFVCIQWHLQPGGLLKPVCVHDPKAPRAQSSLESYVLNFWWTLCQVLPIITVLLCNLDTVGSAKSLLDITIDGELSSGQTTDHEQSSRQTSERTTETQFTSNLDET